MRNTGVTLGRKNGQPRVRLALCTKQGVCQCVTQKVAWKHIPETRASHEETRKSTA